MKKKLLLLALALACLSCLFAVTVSATDDTPTLSVNYTNLSFKDSVYIKYAVAAENVAPEDVRLLVFTEPQDDYTDESKATVLMPKYLDTVNGAEHIIFDYTNLAARQMTDEVYACAMVKVGNKTYYSNIKKYSILQYAISAINKTTTKTSLKNMLKGMLDYGALAQTHFAYKADRPANGTWYSITVEGGTLSDGFTTGMYLRNDEITLTADPASKEGMFPHWMNSAGEIIGREATLTVPATANETYTMTYADAPLGIVEGLEFSLNEDGNTYTLVGIGNCKDTEIYIPAEYKDKKVTAIGEKALAELSGITKIVVGENVKTIGTRAFYACPDLVELTIPASVTSIGNQITYKSNNLTTVYYDSSFVPDSASSFLKQTSITHVVFDGTRVPDSILYGCTNIQKVTIGKNVTSIGYRAFHGCSALTEVVFKENSQLKGIGPYAFYNCTSLTSIEIPSSVTSIGDRAFYNCTSLTSVTFGENSQLTSIGYEAFYNCTSLASIEIPDSVTSIGEYAFSGCTSLKSVYITDLAAWCAISFYDYDSNPLCNGADLYINGVKATDIVIPDSVASIGKYAFYRCTSLASIEIPDSVTSIGPYAFYNCTGLTSIEIPDSVASIGNAAFEGCTSLTSIEIPDSVMSIGDDAFEDCTSLTSIEIPDSVMSIGSGAFSGCTSLTSIEIPDSVTSIGEKAFCGCTSLASIEIPDSVASIGEYAFSGCTSLMSIEILDSVTSIGGDAFYNCTSLKSVYINDLAAWCAISFYNYSSNPLCNGADLYINGVKATDIVIPDSVASIRNYAFFGCTSLASVTFGENSKLTSIGVCAFSDCTSLASIEIPDSVTSIGDYAFHYCTSLTTVYYGGTATEWDAITIGSSNAPLTGATRYYYSETQPTEEGNWWHYVDGVPTAW